MWNKIKSWLKRFHNILDLSDECISELLDL